jgi:hypothetical protein
MPEPYDSTASVTVGTNLTMQNLYQTLTTPTTRGKVGEVDISCPATPADQIAEFFFNRTTTAGSGGTAITPAQDDPGGPAGQFGVNAGSFSAEPTYTSGKTLWRLNCHQRNTVRWIPRDGKEAMLIATQNNGLGLRSLSFSSGTGVAYDSTVSWIE